MVPRSHQARLLHDLKEIRDELASEIGKLEPGQFEYAPEASMKSIKALLEEIGTMEKLCTSWLAKGVMPSWNDAVTWRGTDAASTMADLAAVRAETVAYLESADEAKLQAPVALPEDWLQYFPVANIEPEELIRWVCRHEYYHLGQIITYRWILGDDPYAKKD